MKIQTILYIDDFGIKHYTTVQEEWELRFFKNRFSYVKIIEEGELIESANQAGNNV